MTFSPCCENCWDFLTKVLKRTHGPLLVIGGQMRVAERHRNPFMPQQVFHRGQVHTCHHQTAREGMPQVMKCEIVQSRFAYRTLECRPKIAIWSTVWCAKHWTSVEASILTALSVAVNTSFIGMLRLSPFFAYPERTVITLRRKSISLHVRESNSDARNPVCNAVMTNGFK